MLANKRTFWLLLFLILALLAGSYALAVRPWHAGWGATPEELIMPLPGDDLSAGARAVTTRAVTIHAPPENLFGADMHNADAIDPALQQIAVGDTILFTQMGLHATVAAIKPKQVLVLDGGWTFYLQPIDAGDTRLIVRYFCKD